MKNLLIRCLVLLAGAALAVAIGDALNVVIAPMFAALIALTIAATSWILTYGFHDAPSHPLPDVRFGSSSHTRTEHDIHVRRIESDFRRAAARKNASDAGARHHLRGVAHALEAEARTSGAHVRMGPTISRILHEREPSKPMTPGEITRAIRELDHALTTLNTSRRSENDD